MSAENIGTPIKLKEEAFDLPLLMRAGVGYRALDDKLLIGLETDVPTDNALVVAVGMEYAVADKFYPRLGYRYNDIFNPWTAGLGMKFDQWGFDLSVVPFGELGLTYRGSSAGASASQARAWKPARPMPAPSAWARAPC